MVESKFWKYTGEFFAFIGAFTVVFLLIATLSGNMKWHFGPPKIVSKKMHALKTYDGYMSATYKICTETEVEEVIENRKEFMKGLNELIKNGGETIESAIFNWDQEFEAGETFAIPKNQEIYIYEEGMHVPNIPKVPPFDVKYGCLPDKEYEKYINNEVRKIEIEIKNTKDKFYLTRLDVPNSYKGIYVDVRIGTPDGVRDLTYGWIAKGWATPIVTNHPGHNEALAYAKEHKVGMWGGNSTEIPTKEGQDSTFIEIPSAKFKLGDLVVKTEELQKNNNDRGACTQWEIIRVDLLENRYAYYCRESLLSDTFPDKQSTYSKDTGRRYRMLSEEDLVIGVLNGT